MRQIPLFPLPVVLYPRAVLPLHIFEPRYRRMVAHCLEFDRQFGLLYHDPDRSGPFLNEPGTIGCVAEIQHMQVLEDGRSLILTRGQERFRIVEGVEADTPYYQAIIEPYGDVVGDDADLRARRAASLALFEAFLKELPERPDPLPDFAIDEELAFRIAATVETDPAWHQDVLEQQDERARLARVDRIFRAARQQMGNDE